jgi:outer membrane receptor protein involved in Fe transport
MSSLSRPERRATAVRLILTVCACLGAVHAAESDPVVKLAPVTVTAQKRAQSSDEVPAPLAAFSGDFLDRTGISDFTEIAPLVPGLFVQEQSPNAPGFNIRGITSDSGDPRYESRVSLFQDGVAISRAHAALVELFDLERVEILKGPQGTLFGRSAEVGAVALVQNKARDEHAGRLALGFGNEDERLARGFVNAPIVPGELFGRVAFSWREHAGTVDNLADDSDLNGRRTAAVRTALRWQPSADTTADLIVNWQHDTPPGTAFKSGIIPTSAGDTDPFTAAELNRGGALGIERSVWGATALVEHRWDGDWTFTSTTGWREYDTYDQLDADGSPLYLLELNEDSHGRQFSQEFRLNYEADRVAGFVGANFFREQATQRGIVGIDERAMWPFLMNDVRTNLIAGGVPAALVNAALPAAAPFTPITHLPASLALLNQPALPASVRGLALLAGQPLKPLHQEEYINDGTTQSAEVFADTTVQVTSRFDVTAGVRVSREHYTAGYNAPAATVPSTLGFIFGAAPNFAFAPTDGRLEADGENTSWVARLIGRYAWTPRLSFYASVARGRRPPGAVLDATTVTRLREEVVWNGEVGAKGRSADGRLAWNASVFRYLYSNFQTVVADPRTPGRFIPADAGNATGQGGEFSLEVRPVRALTAFATYGYTDATYDETGDDGRRQQFAGNMFRLTSRHTVSLGSTFTVALARGKLAITPLFSYRSEHYFEDDNSAFNYSLRQGGYGRLDLRLRWNTPDERWAVAVAANNLFDRRYLIDAGNTGGAYGIPTFIAGSPRRLSVQIERGF